MYIGTYIYIYIWRPYITKSLCACIPICFYTNVPAAQEREVFLGDGLCITCSFSKDSEYVEDAPGTTKHLHASCKHGQ